jgi:hypothetical protein
MFLHMLFTSSDTNRAQFAIDNLKVSHCNYIVIIAV